jgi:TusA-related sulfurtransferase
VEPDGSTPAPWTPDHLLDGGDLDCGSGLVLLIREHMQRVPEGGILELRSRERTVCDDLPPWCRMVGHDYLGSLPGATADQKRFFVRRGAAAAATESAALAADKARARGYEWRLRARSTGGLRSTAYCRNFSFVVGQPASFEERDDHPSALEYLMGALAGDLATGFATACSQVGLQVDDVEITVRAKLHNVLAHLGLEEGDPSLESVSLKAFASTLEDETRVRTVWDEVLRRSPLFTTLAKATRLETQLTTI